MVFCFCSFPLISDDMGLKIHFTRNIPWDIKEPIPTPLVTKLSHVKSTWPLPSVGK